MDGRVGFALGIAGGAPDHGTPSRFLPQPLYGHDGENLSDCPAVRERLEDGEITKINITKEILDVVEFLGGAVQLAGKVADFGARGPVQPLREAAKFQAQIS